MRLPHPAFPVPPRAPPWATQRGGGHRRDWPRVTTLGSSRGRRAACGRPSGDGRAEPRGCALPSSPGRDAAGAGFPRQPPAAALRGVHASLESFLWHKENCMVLAFLSLRNLLWKFLFLRWRSPHASNSVVRGRPWSRQRATRGRRAVVFTCSLIDGRTWNF